MVKIVDITEEKKRKRLEEKLMKKCFRKQQVYVGNFSILVHPRRTNNFIGQQRTSVLAHKSIGKPRMKIYDEEVLREAEMFATEYEEQFMKEADSGEKFVIEPEYHKR